MKSILSSVVDNDQLERYSGSGNKAVSGAAIRARIVGLSTARVVLPDGKAEEVPCDRIEIDSNKTLLCLSPDQYVLAAFDKWDRVSLNRPDSAPVWATL